MRTLWTNGSHISRMETFMCLAELVDGEVYYVGTNIWASMNKCWTFYKERVLRWLPLEACLEFFAEENKRLQTKLVQTLFILGSLSRPSQKFTMMCDEHLVLA